VPFTQTQIDNAFERLGLTLPDTGELELAGERQRPRSGVQDIVALPEGRARRPNVRSGVWPGSGQGDITVDGVATADNAAYLRQDNSSMHYNWQISTRAIEHSY
jgi:hypothetical protein